MSADEAAQALRTQLALHQLVTDIVARFAQLEVEGVDAGIDLALAEIGEFVGVDRCYVFRFDDDTVSNTHEWCAPGIEPQIDELQDVPVSVVAAWVEPLTAGEQVYIPVVADLPPQRAEEREILEPQGIQSLLVVPLRTGDRLAGFVGFDSVRQARSWPAESIGLLRTVGDVLVGALSRREAFEALQHSREQLRIAAATDSLTGLPNRAAFLDRLGGAVSRWERNPAGLAAVLFLDLDGFKVVNDSLGHSAGDRLLALVSHRMGEILRSTDTLARFGGDEFTVLCSSVKTLDEILEVARRLAGALNEPFTVDDVSLSVTASIGVALIDRTGLDPEGLLRDADTAMYRAKDLGRNRIELFNEELRAGVRERLEIASALRHAVPNDELRLVYQPVVNPDSGQLLGLEALLRWEHPTRGLLAPGAFLDIAEDTGAVVGLGTWVLAESCRQLGEWRRQFPAMDVKLGVNLSARQLADPHLPAILEAVASAGGVAPSGLVLEITESTLMRDADETLTVLHDLKDLGAVLAIDDFGTGFSSLSYLRRFPVDILKIDRSFVWGLGNGSQDAAIVAAVRSLGEVLSLDVVAEGVETEEQRQALIGMGCEFAQGYLFSRPVPPDQVAGYLAGVVPWTQVGSGEPTVRTA